MRPPRGAQWDFTAAIASGLCAIEGLLLAFPLVGYIAASWALGAPKWSVIAAALIFLAVSAIVAGILAWRGVMFIKTTKIASSRIRSAVTGAAIIALSFGAPLNTSHMHSHDVSLGDVALCAVLAIAAGVLHYVMAPLVQTDVP